ncbi:MAG TPA: DUF2934 domain-containing protein [Gallionella sp.]
MAAKKAAVTKTKKAPVSKLGTASREKKDAAKKPETPKTNVAAVRATQATTARGNVPEKNTAVGKPKVSGGGQNRAAPTPEERYRMVQTAAYFIAERCGFQGDSAAHWAAAELEITAMLKMPAPR